MGSLSSRPSVPAQPQVIFVPTQTTTTTSTATPSTETYSQSSEELPQSASEARTESLLRRSRGRFGTVQTSLRGLLGLSSADAGRKTLLGE